MKYQPQAAAMAAALRQQYGGDSVLHSSDSLVGGTRWLEDLQKRIRTSDAFVFLFGSHIGNWQRVEFADAFDRKVSEDAARAKDGRAPLPMVPVVVEEAAPAVLLRRDD